jgi:hypothetical protein
VHLAAADYRLQRLEAAEYAIICSEIEAPAPLPKPTNPKSPNELEDLLPHEPAIDSRDIAAAFINAHAHLDHLHKIEVHLRRAYNRTWDRLQRMQKERKNIPLDEALKQSQIWATYEATRTNHPHNIPPRHPAIDEKGKLIVYPKDHPMWRPAKKEDEDESDDKNSKIE